VNEADVKAASREARMDEALAEHIMRADAGKRFDRDELYAAHPDCAAEMRAYYEVSDRLYRLIESCGLSKEPVQDRALEETLVRTDTRPAARPSPSPTRTFGDYELIEMIAKGGMGVVYKARQRKLNRLVAVKMILAGQFADETDVERFYAEAEAAANLRHPNIVAIHEVGEFEGQHFFSMDFIEGQTLGDLVRENPLSARRAAQYVKTVAETMHFAHEQGFLHRDLKPSNVMLDRNGEPLIMDFGLAKKATGETSQLTISGAIVGTPSYMPPEQAAGRNDDVTARSDVYSIGAILYELLTGRPPFRATNPYETIKQVLELEPASPRVLNDGIPRDLETICLKCLQKEPARRYTSGQDLADELQRFLDGMPIRARPISLPERAWRWCRRNPVLASAMAIAATGILVALIAVTGAYIRTKAALAESDKSFRQALDAVNELFTEVSEDTLLQQPGMQPLRKSLLSRALEYYERFRQQRGDDPTVQDELALATFRVGKIKEAIESPEAALVEYERAREMQDRLLAQRPHDTDRLQNLSNTFTAMGPAYFALQRPKESLEAFGKAVELREQLAAANPHDSEIQRLLANSYMNIGLIEMILGDTASRNGNAQDAQTHNQESLRQFTIAQTTRDNALREAPTDSKLRRDRGKGNYNLANLRTNMGDLEQAEQHIDAAIAEITRLVEQGDIELDTQANLAICIRRKGDFAFEAGDDVAALTEYNKALPKMVALARENPLVIKYQGDLGGIYKNIGVALSALNRDNEARDAFMKARDVLQPLVNQYPIPRYQHDLYETLEELEKLPPPAGSPQLAPGSASPL
jgi:serine/threonine protein kinase